MYEIDAKLWRLTSFIMAWHHLNIMRTTLTLDDDIIESVKTFAESRDLSLGRAVSELVRRGLRAPMRFSLKNGVPVVELPPDSPVVTEDDVRRLRDDFS
jgi:hypothetical protein